MLPISRNLLLEQVKIHNGSASRERQRPQQEPEAAQAAAMAATPPPTLTTMRALAAALIVLLLWSGALASPAPLLENLSLDHYSAPGPYHMAAPLMVDAPKASAFRQSYGYAPVAVYFPTDNPGGTALADPNKTPDGTFHVIGFAHGAGTGAMFLTDTTMNPCDTR